MLVNSTDFNIIMVILSGRLSIVLIHVLSLILIVEWRERWNICMYMWWSVCKEWVRTDTEIERKAIV